MPRTTGRTLELLALLQSRREWPGGELRERLEVSARTLRRDVEDLRGLGYGIESVPGVGGGYRLGAGASIPPLVLSSEEAVAIAVGLRVAATTTVTGMEDAAARALATLEQSLSSETRERIAAIEETVIPLGASAEKVDLDTVVIVARAIRESRGLRIDYVRHDGEEVRRTIRPHRIVHTGTRWYVVALDPERDAWRTLRLDRLTPRLPLADRFEPMDVPDDIITEFATRSITTAPYPHRYRILMRAPAHEVAAHFGPAIAEVAPVDDRACLLTAGAESPEQFAGYIAMTGIDFEVIDGSDLRGVLAGMGARLIRASNNGQ